MVIEMHVTIHTPESAGELVGAKYGVQGKAGANYEIPGPVAPGHIHLWWLDPMVFS